jgi:hypothetical protein
MSKSCGAGNYKFDTRRGADRAAQPHAIVFSPDRHPNPGPSDRARITRDSEGRFQHSASRVMIAPGRVAAVADWPTLWFAICGCSAPQGLLDPWSLTMGRPRLYIVPVERVKAIRKMMESLFSSVTALDRQTFV